MSSSHGAMKTMDILATIFFVCAGVWLILAILYSVSVLVFLRMRQRGLLDDVNEPTFGRLYLFGTGCYIPMGWLFRYYTRHLSGFEEPEAPVRVMSRRERRAAMESLLRGALVLAKTVNDKHDERSSDQDEEKGTVNDADTVEGPMCSICLEGYAANDFVLKSPVCSHEFHKDCCLSWLQRSGNVECPCCRVALVTEDEVWETVQRHRKKRKEHRKEKKERREAMEETERTADESYHEDNLATNV